MTLTDVKSLRRALKESESVEGGEPSRAVVDARRGITREMAVGGERAKDLSAAKRYQDPALEDGLVDKSGYVGLRSSRLQVTSMGARNKRSIWILGPQNALLEAVGLR